MANGQTSVTVSAGRTATARFSRAALGVCRVDGTILFATARSFIYPRYKPVLEQVFSSGLERPASGARPVQKSDQFLLIFGHSDQAGKRQSNQALSERRANAALAVFTLDAKIWEALFQTEKWGVNEIGEMSAQVDIGGSSALIQHYQTDAQARLDLMERYLIFLRPDWLPQESPPIGPATVTSPSPPTLGCGEDLPVRDVPDTAEEKNRRTEFFYFRQPDPGVRQCPSRATYRTWQAACGQFITMGIELHDEYGDPYVGPFDLTLPTGGILRGERTDGRGAWTRGNLPAGQYTVTVAGSSVTLIR